MLGAVKLSSAVKRRTLHGGIEDREDVRRRRAHVHIRVEVVERGVVQVRVLEDARSDFDITVRGFEAMLVRLDRYGRPSQRRQHDEQKTRHADYGEEFPWT